jgi:creatinine amidohydrolase
MSFGWNMQNELRTVCMEWLRPAEIAAERQRCPLVYLPIGPLEWHGLHLPYGTDALNAGAVARKAALRTGGVVLPTLFCGTERERPPDKLKSLGFDENAYVVGMDFPGNLLPSLYFPEEIFALIVRAYLDLLLKMDYKLVVLVNGHGARNQVEALKRLCREYNALGKARVLSEFAFPGPDSTIVGHADAYETSIILALNAESVDISQLPPLGESLFFTATGIVDAASFQGRRTSNHSLPEEADPRLRASVEWGEEILERTVAGLVASVRRALLDLGFTGKP